MTNMSERTSLANRYASMRADGLVDVKFLLSNSAETTNEEVCREVNAMHQALDRGDWKALDFGDRSQIQ